MDPDGLSVQITRLDPEKATTQAHMLLPFTWVSISPDGRIIHVNWDAYDPGMLTWTFENYENKDTAFSFLVFNRDLPQ